MKKLLLLLSLMVISLSSCYVVPHRDHDDRYRRDRDYQDRHYDRYHDGRTWSR